MVQGWEHEKQALSGESTGIRLMLFKDTLEQIRRAIVQIGFEDEVSMGSRPWSSMKISIWAEDGNLYSCETSRIPTDTCS